MVNGEAEEPIELGDTVSSPGGGSIPEGIGPEDPSPRGLSVIGRSLVLVLKFTGLERLVLISQRELKVARRISR